MEVKIGVTHVNRELSIDTTMSADEVEKAVADATGGGVLTLHDARGRRVVVPGEKIDYVDVTTSVTGTVGFRS